MKINMMDTQFPMIMINTDRQGTNFEDLEDFYLKAKAIKEKDPQGVVLYFSFENSDHEVATYFAIPGSLFNANPTK